MAVIIILFLIAFVAFSGSMLQVLVAQLVRVNRVASVPGYSDVHNNKQCVEAISEYDGNRCGLPYYTYQFPRYARDPLSAGRRF